MTEFYDEYGGATKNITIAMWYKPEESRGVGLLVATGMLSLLSVLALLCIMGISAFKSIRAPEKHQFIRTHVAAYFVSLLLCDLAQGIGALLNIRWITQGGVEVGSYCTAQAVIKQTGNVGTALWSFVIAVHTFNVLFLRWHIADYVCYGTLVAVWSFLGFIVILGSAVVEKRDKGPFYGISGYWCWITPDYPTERYTLEYLFMFSSAGLSFILYSLIFLRLRGNITVSGWRICFHRVRKSSGQDSTNNGIFHDGRRDPHLMQVARQMLWYPVAYTILVLPIAAARFSAFTGKPVPFAVTIFTASIFMLSGFINAILFTTTRRVLPVPSGWKKRGILSSIFSRSSRDEKDTESAGAGPFISTTTTTQVDEPYSPTARGAPVRPLQPQQGAFSPVAPFNAYAPPLSAVSSQQFPQHGQRPAWAPARGRSGSVGSARSGGSAVTITGAPIVQPAGGYYPYSPTPGPTPGPGRARSGSEGSVQYQASVASSSTTNLNKTLPAPPRPSREGANWL